MKRRLAIADLVRKEGEVRVEDLSGRLKVSAVTIRSDLTYLEHEGLLARRFGKAIAQQRHPAGEGAIAPDRARFRDVLVAAAAMLEGEQNILVGRGSLPIQLIPLLGDTPDLSLTVASLDAVAVARSCIDCEIHILGGRLDQDGSTMSGSKALSHLRQEIPGAYVFEAEAVDIDPTGLRPSCFLFGSHDEASFAATASEHATRTLALIRSAAFATEAGAAGPRLEAVQDLVFPAPPDDACAAYLAGIGYACRTSPSHSAVVYSRPAPTRVRREQ